MPLRVVLMIKVFNSIVITIGLMLVNVSAISAQEPPPVNPFGSTIAQREDTVPGYVELSDGSIHPGQIYLTRDKRLKIADEQSERQREIPLHAVKQIDCTINLFHRAEAEFPVAVVTARPRFKHLSRCKIDSVLGWIEPS